jgi:peroxiredoxin (alkyl hydroperoxide reductase subunit C)
VFVVDPKGILRAIVYYPLTTGRNVEELIRLVTALQTSDEHAVATPNWQPDDKVIVPAPSTAEAAAERVASANGYECVDWYLCRKSV